MAHRTFLALALGLLALAGGCTQSSDPEPAPEEPGQGDYASLSTNELSFCCDPNAPFPQAIGTFTLTTFTGDYEAFTPTGDLEVGEPVLVGYLDQDGNPTQDPHPFRTIQTYTVYANACPPPDGWKIEVKVTGAGHGEFEVEDLLIENTCPPAADPPVELACGDALDQLFLAQGQIVNVTTADPVLVVGTDEGVCGGTVTGGLTGILGPFSGPFYGGCLLRHVPSSSQVQSANVTQAALAYGPNGVALRGYDTDWGFTQVDPAIQGVDRNTTDAIPTANDPDSAQAIITRYGRNRVDVLSYDTTTDYFTSGVSLGLSSFPGANGKPVSACRPEVDGPLYVLFNSVASQLYVKDDPSDLSTPAVLAATLGNDGRRVRHEGNLLFVGSFADDTLAVLLRGATVTVVVTVTVGDGPIGIHTKTLPNGDIAVITTGFNDHTFTITIVHADGTLVSSVTEPVPTGGLNPGSGVFLPDGKVAISCNGSDKIVVFVP